MPQIKPYEIQTQVSGPPDVETPRLSDFGRAGEGMQQLANSGMRFGEILRQNQERNEVSDIHANISQVHSDYTTKLRDQVNDGSLKVDDFKQDLQDNLDKMGQNYSTPAGQRYFQQSSAALKAHFIEQSALGQAELSGQKAKVDFQTGLNASSTALMNDPSSFELSNKMQQQAVDNLVQTGGLPAMKANELKLQAQETLAKSALRGWIALNPLDAREQLNKGQWDSYLSGDQKHQMFGETEQAIRAKEVEDMRLQRQQQEALAAQQTDTQNQFLAKLQSGDLSTKDVLSSNLDPFGSGSKEQFINLLRTNQEKKVKTDPYVMNELFNRIHAPDGDPSKITDENELNKYFGQGLSLSDLKSLRNEISDKGTVQGDANQLLKKNFTSMAFNAIAKPDPVTKLPDPQGALNYQMWLSDFLGKYQSGLKNGKSTNQLLDPKSPDYLGNNINQFQRTPEQIIKDMVKGRGTQFNENPQPAGTPAPMVDVISPQGQSGKIPAASLPDALKRGFREIK